MSTRILEALYDSSAFGEQSRIADIMLEYEDLSDPELAKYVGKVRDRETDARTKKQLDYLYFDVVGTVVYKDLAPIGDEIADLEAGSVVRVNGEDIAYRDLGNRLFNETESALRESLYLAQGRFDVTKTNPLRAETVRLQREKLRDYGYPDLDALEAERRHLDFDAFARQADAFLADTRDMYWELSNEAARSVFGVDVTKVSDYDRGRLFRAAEYDRYFPAERMLPLVRETLAGMGIDLAAIPAVTHRRRGPSGEGAPRGVLSREAGEGRADPHEAHRRRRRLRDAAARDWGTRSTTRSSPSRNTSSSDWATTAPPRPTRTSSRRSWRTRSFSRRAASSPIPS